VSNESLRAELFAMVESEDGPRLNPLAGDDQPDRVTPEALAERHEVSVDVVHETVTEVAATIARRKWGLEPPTAPPSDPSGRG
jgi:hypothetical protein